MKFIGQQRIWVELEFIVPELQAGKNINIIIRAPSGYGKTKLAAAIANAINPESIDYNIPDGDGNIEIDTEKRIIIIDEIHTLVNPERIYPIMDSKEHVMILCSNEFGELKEPLVNRCVDLIFDKYSAEEITAICGWDFKENGMQIPLECLEELARNCNLNPRIARNISDRLVTIFKRIGVPNTKEEIKEILKNILQIEDGLNPLHRRYLEYLAKVNRASLDSISFATRLDKKTITKEIEPVLAEKNLITITSRGRQIL